MRRWTVAAAVALASLVAVVVPAAVSASAQPGPAVDLTFDQVFLLDIPLGEPVTAPARVLNVGAHDAVDVVVTYTIPDGVDVAEIAPGCVAADPVDGAAVACAFDVVPAGGQVDVSVQLVLTRRPGREIPVAVRSAGIELTPEDNRTTISMTAIPLGPTAELLEGATPTDAAVAVSRLRFGGAAGTAVHPGGAPDTAAPDYAVVARADLFADALGASVLLGRGPLLLTGPDELDPRTAAELARLDVDRTYVLGGEQALGSAVVDAIPGTVVRLAGESRVETAIAAADEAVALGIADGRAAGLARAGGEGSAAWVDAISGGAWAADAGVPILLTPADGLHPAVAGWLAGAEAVTLLGGEGALAPAVEAALPASWRVAGPDRFGTAIQVARQLRGVLPQGDRGYVVAPASHEGDWGYGLAAAGVAADLDRPILLLADPVPEVVLAEVVGCEAQVSLLAVGQPTWQPVAALDAVDEVACS